MGWSKTPNEASQARVGKNGEAYNTLKARLDAENERVTTQLAQTEQLTNQKINRLEDEKASKKELSNAVNSLVSKTYVDGLIGGITTIQPRDIYYSITALQAALPNGDEGLYLVYDSTFTDGAHSFIWSASQSIWKDTGVWQAEAIADGTVTEQKTSFARKSYNLFDKRTVTKGFILQQSDGQLIANELWSTSEEIYLDGVSRTFKRSHVALVIAFKADDTVGQVWTAATTNITTSIDHAYLKISIYTRELDVFSFVKSTDLFEPESEKVVIDDLAVKFEQLPTVITGFNNDLATINYDANGRPSNVVVTNGTTVLYTVSLNYDANGLLTSASKTQNNQTVTTTLTRGTSTSLNGKLVNVKNTMTE